MSEVKKYQFTLNTTAGQKLVIITTSFQRAVELARKVFGVPDDAEITMLEVLELNPYMEYENED